MVYNITMQSNRNTMLNIILESINKNRVTIFQGLRRIGKTVILEDIKERLTKNGHNVLSFEFGKLFGEDEKFVKGCELIFKQDKEIYLLIDEYQYFDEWIKWFKLIYDMYPNVKIVATGSVSSNLMHFERTDGSRFVFVNVPPLLFSEYIAINNESLSLEQKFLNFITMGSYPLYANQSDQASYQSFINNLIKDKIYNTALLKKVMLNSHKVPESLLNHIIVNLGGFTSIAEICKKLNSRYEYIDKALLFLESNYLIYRLDNYNRQAGKAMMWNGKYYLTDPSFFQLIKKSSFELLEYNDREYASMIFENSILNHITFEAKLNNMNLYFLKNNKFDIDVVIEKNDSSGKPIYVEIKMSDRDDCLSKSQEEFSKENQLYIIYKGETKVQNNKRYINYLEFLLSKWLAWL